MGRLALIESIEQAQLKKDIPDFRIGDTVKVMFKIIEGDKERLQAFTGLVIARKGSGLSENVVLYRTAYGSAMKRVFMLNSPRVGNIDVVRRGKVRKSKLYYVCGATGKASKVKERIGIQETAGRSVVSTDSNEA
jgi:large subunit ribosomal protein L19